MAENKKNASGGGDWGWVLIILCFCSGFLWPLGLLLLFGKLFAEDEKKPARQAPPLQGTAAQAAAGASAAPRRQTKAAKAVKKVTKSPKLKKSNAWWLKIGGLVLLLFGLGTMGDAVGTMMLPDAMVRWWLEDLMTAAALSTGGAAMLFSGFSMERKLKRFSKYLLVMGDRGAVPVDELARTLGYSERRVEKDLEKMIDKGYFGGKAYLNMELGYLFRGGGAEADFRQRFQEAREAQEAAEEPKAPPREAEEGYSGILRSIRRANDRIADPVLSAKIDRLEEITAKIFKAVEEDPRKKDRIGTFLNYYLPTTLKILRAYAQLDAQGIEGENISAAKKRIEDMMDQVVSGFEKQLDKLFQDDAMDITSDVEVLENMLKKDGLSDEGGITMTL